MSASPSTPQCQHLRAHAVVFFEAPEHWLELAAIAEDLSVFGFETVTDEEFGEDFTLDDGGKKPFQQISLTLHDKQAELLHAAIAHVYANEEVAETFGNENKNGNGIYEVVRQWVAQKKLS